MLVELVTGPGAAPERAHIEVEALQNPKHQIVYQEVRYRINSVTWLARIDGTGEGKGPRKNAPAALVQLGAI